MSNDVLDEALAGLIGFGLGFAVSRIYLSAAETAAQSSAAAVRQQNNTAMVELVIAAACCGELLGLGPSRRPPVVDRELAIASTEKLAELSLGAPVVT